MSGRLLATAGIALLLTLPLDALLRVAACLAWGVLSCIELQRLEDGYSRCRAIRLLAGGEVQMLGSDAQWLAASLLNGSVVLQRLAWLRLELPDGRQCAELLGGDSRQSQDWRRLQVIWRHIGAAQ